MENRDKKILNPDIENNLIEHQFFLIEHRIDVAGATPVRSNATTQLIMNEHDENLLQCGIIRLSVSPWSSPVIIVPKRLAGRGCV